MNRLKTMMLLAALTALVLFLGQAIGGRQGLYIALFFAAVMNFGSYWFADRIVLSMYHAQPIAREEAPDLYRMTERLAQRAGLPMPRLYVLPEDTPNAFATGRSPEKGVVAVTAGITRLLSRDELAAVIAHELGHIKNRDTLIMTVAAALAGALSHLATMALWFGGSRHHDDEEGAASPLAGLVGILVAPLAASLIQMAISRSREFLADEAAARYSGDPLALARALRKIESWSRRIPMHDGSPATAHLFIINPFSGGGLVNLFRTHPPTEQRIARLEEMANSGEHLQLA